MKLSYEDCYRIKLPSKMPLIIRIDGCHFHSYTKKCKKPVDENLVECMNETAKYLCKNVHGTKLAYIQSDEISLLLTNFDKQNTQSYFDNNLQKIVSVTASLASSYFTSISSKIFGDIKLAQFDSRAFVLPKEEVNNYFIFRQQDAIRNSVQMLARSIFPHKECQNKNCKQLKEMLLNKKIDWNKCPTTQQRGRCIKKQVSKKYVNESLKEIVRFDWIIDNSIPIFSEDKSYIDNFLIVQENNS
jgi:tRNA(His) 5'-end guanylyltransferase